ncbi:MAG: hypothetical protein GFH27_549293n108 [Chloroflexi bacterium AL-W]|nr:hypothetical protein [Chloroflexi bacterium AL-N1]NOK67777.1 hypothetical protein [Chloroflexi bacterium AL-N10]NOK75453.1 hypothetical protein [Chloroflexi bacterium AL-N5]NOK82241.1 hypothetical protein [Chloroflexi bacterium AL-W]NOK90086.1 hypothetical protein [Chloroflexi bacterium AL-N15]
MCRYNVVRIFHHRRVAIFLLAGILTIPVSIVWSASTPALAQGGPTTRDPSTNPAAAENATTAEFVSAEEAEVENNDRGIPDWAEPAADVLIAGLDLLGVDKVDKIANLVNAGLNLTDILTGGDGINTSSAENPPPSNGPPPTNGPQPTINVPAGVREPLWRRAQRAALGVPGAVGG